MDELDSFEEENQIDEDFSLVDFTEENLVFNKIKITSPIMTIYEKVCIISERVKYLDNGYKTTVEEEVTKLGLIKKLRYCYVRVSDEKTSNILPKKSDA